MPTRDLYDGTTGRLVSSEPMPEPEPAELSTEDKLEALLDALATADADDVRQAAAELRRPTR